MPNEPTSSFRFTRAAAAGRALAPWAAAVLVWTASLGSVHAEESAANSAPTRQAYDEEKPPPVQPPRRRRRNGLLIAGASVLVGSYLFSVAVGGELSSGETTPSGQTCTNCDAGKLLFVPVVGPWLLLPHADGAAGRAVCTVMGIAQAVGLLLTVGGIVRRTSGSAYAQAPRSPRLTFQAVPSRDGARAALSLRF